MFVWPILFHFEQAPLNAHLGNKIILMHFDVARIWCEKGAGGCNHLTLHTQDPLKHSQLFKTFLKYASSQNNYTLTFEISTYVSGNYRNTGGLLLCCMHNDRKSKTHSAN